MSSELINPIHPTQFALAIQDLPLDTLHAKAAEIQNSQIHLRHSNEQMLPFADQGDQDCKDAMFENLTVIGRMNERIALLRAEVERRGMRWGEGEVEDRAEHEDVGMEGTNGTAINGINGTATNGTTMPVDGAAEATARSRVQNGRLTDEELRRQIEAQMAEGDGEEGVHL